MLHSVQSKSGYPRNSANTQTSISSPLDYDLGGFFEPYVLQYLVNTDLQTAQWVHTVGVIAFVRVSPDYTPSPGNFSR